MDDDTVMAAVRQYAMHLIAVGAIPPETWVFARVLPVWGQVDDGVKMLWVMLESPN